MTDGPINPMRAVVITGASTGIGAACAIDLEQQGFHVFAGVRKAEDGRRLQERASKHLTPILLDVTDAASIAAAAASISQQVGDGGLAGLVNNAGIVVVGPLEILPIEELRRQFEVNVIGQIAVTQAMTPLLRAGRGRVVNIGSLNGLMAPPYFGPYAASKHAMEALTDSLRVELRNWGILVSIVEPGSVQTPIWDKSHATADELFDNLSPQQRELYGEELAAVKAAGIRLAEQSMPVQRVVEAVRHALCAKRPRTRYPVGMAARMAGWARRFLHDRVRDWVFCKELGLKITGKTKYRF